MKLRSYQRDCVLDILTAWEAGVRRPAVVLPTGAGKTVVFAALCVLQARAGHRPVVLVNRDELVAQTVDKLRATDPHLSIGIIRAEQNETRGEITVASVQTLSRMSRLSKLDPSRFDRIIADECHYAAADSWRRVLDYFDAPDTRVVGFTATMTRTDKRGLGEIWSEIVFTRDTRWAIEAGFLVPVRAITVTIPELDLSGVKVRNGDLADGDLGRAMTAAKSGPLLAAAYHQHARNEAGNLRRGIVFAPTIDTAQAFLGDFLAAGIPTEMVIGTTPRAERQASYARTASGANTVLMSVGVLTTGFDLPAVEVAVIARPTKAKGLYQQMVGRALRLSPDTGKVEALILDVAGAARMGLASIVDLNLDGEIEEEAPTEREPLLPGARIPEETPDLEQVDFEEIDPFNAVRLRLARRAATQRWLQTKGGVPFLPATSTFAENIFLWPEDDNTWTVGSCPKAGRIERIATGLAFPLAVEHAVKLYPVAKRLVGDPSPGQLRMLLNFGYEPSPFLDRQGASEAIAIELMSRQLD